MTTAEWLIDWLSVLCQVDVLLSDIEQLESEHGQRPELEDARDRAQVVRQRAPAARFDDGDNAMKIAGGFLAPPGPRPARGGKCPRRHSAVGRP